jgi:hypothetical protein
MKTRLEPRSPRPMPTRNGRKRLGKVVGRASGVIDVGLSTAGRLFARVPGTVRATLVGANATTSALQVLPNSTLGGLAASSIGLGTGLYLAGVPRLVAAAAVSPAIIVGAAIVLRPADPVAGAGANP